ncbi:MAG: MlaD family protein [Solirubrobacteraceae bacterium]
MRRLRRQRPAGREPRRAVLLSLGVATTALVGLLLYVGYDAPNRIVGRGYYVISAELDDADNVTAHHQVRMGGRNIGQVLHPRVRNGKAVIDLQLNRDVAPLLSDTRIVVRPRSAIGVRFVEVRPGRKGTPLPEGAVLPAASTSATVPLDRALGTLDARRRREATTAARELGRGFADRGEDLAATIGASPRALRRTRSALAPLNARAGAVDGLVRGAEGAAGAADPVRGDIARGLRPGARTLAVIGDHEPGVDRTLRIAPEALADVESGLAATDPLLRAVARLGTVGADTLTHAPPTFRSLARMLRDGRDGLRAAPPVLRRAQAATPPTLALLKALDPVVPAISRTLRTSAPLLEELGRRDCDIGRWFKGWRGVLTLGVDSGKPIGPATALRLHLLTNAESVGGQGPSLAGALPSVRTDAYPEPCRDR